VSKGIIVVAPGWEEYCYGLLGQYGPFRLPWVVVHGGKERQDSVRLGLTQLDNNCKLVVIHDGARPFVTAEVIDSSVEVAEEVGGAIVAIPAKDTIKRVSADGVIAETLLRQELWLAQTPQTFRVPLIREAHAWASANGVLATDDAALVETMGGVVKVVRGDARNIKITTPEDLLLAEVIIQACPDLC
jgi:2-C-methyl-D-erythritol 4-phosphate cytidylyltransferase